MAVDEKGLRRHVVRDPKIFARFWVQSYHFFIGQECAEWRWLPVTFPDLRFLNDRVTFLQAVWRASSHSTQIRGRSAAKNYIGKIDAPRLRLLIF